MMKKKRLPCKRSKAAWVSTPADGGKLNDLDLILLCFVASSVLGINVLCTECLSRMMKLAQSESYIFKASVTYVENLKFGRLLYLMLALFLMNTLCIEKRQLKISAMSLSNQHQVQ